MASLNKVLLIGYLGDEPKIDRLQSGNVKATLSLATTEKGYTTKSGSVIPDRTEWHTVTFWGNLAEVCEKYLHKGSSVYVEGMLRTSSWDDQDGKKRYKTEVAGNALQMLDKKQGEVSGQAAGSTAPQGAGNSPQYQPPVQSAPAQQPIDPLTGENIDGGDDLPF